MTTDKEKLDRIRDICWKCEQDYCLPDSYYLDKIREALGKEEGTNQEALEDGYREASDYKLFLNYQPAPWVLDLERVHGNDLVVNQRIPHGSGYRSIRVARIGSKHAFTSRGNGILIAHAPEMFELVAFLAGAGIKAARELLGKVHTRYREAEKKFPYL